MEEDDQNAPPSTPFWIQSRRNNTYFHRTASLRTRATTVATQVFLTAIAAILIVFFILPPLFSSVSQIFRPHFVRKSWDYLNFVLVLFAVICGFLSRNSAGDDSNRSNREDRKVTSSYESSYDRFSKLPSLDRGRVSNGATPRYWVDDQFSDQTGYKRFGRLRSSSSHPDLRLREFEDEEQWRFYDDTHLSGYRYDATDRIYQSSSTWQESKPAQDSDPIGEGSKPQVTGNGHIGESDSKKVEVVATATNTAEVEEVMESSPMPPYPTSPPQSPPHDPPPAKPAKRKTKRVYQDLPSKEEKERADVAVATPLMPIPPPADVYRKSSKQEKKKGGATKDFLIALRRKKKKKQRQQSIDGLDLLFGSDPISQPSKSPPHPPPPPPPPPFFQGLFSSKKGKSKRTNSTPPPPPPLPPQRNLQSRASISNIGKPPVESRTSKPNPPAKVTAFNRRDEIINTGNESPLMSIPRPPPPPPFKMPAWKFVKRGDYVRMASDISISSDEPDDSDGAQIADGKATGTTDVNLFCPSPDVDTKANNFIARFRAGLKLEKMNSDKRGRSNLGPESEHGPDEFGS